MKPIRRLDEANLIPVKEVKHKQLPTQRVMDPNLTPEQIKEYKAQLQKDRIQANLDRALKEIHQESLIRCSDDEGATPETLAALDEHIRTIDSRRNEYLAKYGIEKQLYTPPEDDGTHIIIRDTEVKDPDLQHHVDVLPGITNPKAAHRNPRFNIPKK